ncbi:flagellar hook-associated protein FlgK [Acetobacter estunensis]|uniref:flagellar hook-associated protein FlgK n=1 Tax=Acetobacter estunensis TaxID=104097 RepID=UPI001C2D490E|nr:flagellar hook-associated protein FlgK [Acetobacter estunensis]MBV1836143.1 flagellar hook-associated protein FlgK [Acetobacter estunensis]
MDLNAALSIATSGLEGTQYALGVVSQNVSNASTTGYVEETAQLNSRDSAGTGSGVKIGLTTRVVNDALQSSLYTQNATVEALTVKSNSLASITALQGSTSSDSGSTATLSDELGNLSNAFSSLVSTPNDSTALNTVISDAGTVVSTINDLSSAYQTQRQQAQDSIVSDVATVNTDLTTIGVLSKQIMLLKVQGQSTADLENQRASAMSDLSSQLSVTFTETSQGDMLVKTANGTQLPTYPTQDGQTLSTYPTSDSDTSSTTAIKTDQPTSTWPLSTSSEELQVTSTTSGTATGSYIPGITLDINGTDTNITSDLTGGSLGANIELRDTVYPKMQAQLDSFSYALASRFSTAGLSLFTDANGNVPSSTTNAETPTGIVGLSSTIEVSPTISADTSLLAPDGSTSVATNILSTAFTDTTAAPSTDLGVDGNISTGYSGNLTLANLATTLTSAQAQVASDTSSNLTSATTVQTSLTSSVSSVSSVSVDNEMSKIVALQNAYEANAKIVTTVQSMFTALLDAV